MLFSFLSSGNQTYNKITHVLSLFVSLIIYIFLLYPNHQIDLTGVCLEGLFGSQDRIKTIYDIFFKTKEKWKEYHSEYINQTKEVHERKRGHSQPISNVLQPDKIRDV